MTIIRGKITTVYRDSDNKPTIPHEVPPVIHREPTESVDEVQRTHEVPLFIDREPTQYDVDEAKNNEVQSSIPRGKLTTVYKDDSIPRGKLTTVHKDDSIQEFESPKGVETALFKPPTEDHELPLCDEEVEALFNAQFGLRS